MAWRNQTLVLFHGTTTLDLNLSYIYLQGFNINPLTSFSVQLSKCRRHTDFGQGFYTTTSHHQARQWANARFQMKASPVGAAEAAVVLSFDVSRDWLAGLQQLHFALPSVDFYDFVDYCRTVGSRPHGRTGGASNYEMVWGPVRMGTQQLVIHDCDQLSFHTQTTCTQLTAKVADLGPLSNTPRPGFIL